MPPSTQEVGGEEDKDRLNTLQVSLPEHKFAGRIQYFVPARHKITTDPGYCAALPLGNQYRPRSNPVSTCNQI